MRCDAEATRLLGDERDIIVVSRRKMMSGAASRILVSCAEKSLSPVVNVSKATISPPWAVKVSLNKVAWPSGASEETS